MPVPRVWIDMAVARGGNNGLAFAPCAQRNFGYLAAAVVLFWVLKHAVRAFLLAAFPAIRAKYRELRNEKVCFLSSFFLSHTDTFIGGGGWWRDLGGGGGDSLRSTFGCKRPIFSLPCFSSPFRF